MSGASSARVTVAPSQTSRVLYASGAVIVVSPPQACGADEGRSYSPIDLSSDARYWSLLGLMVPLFEFFAEVDDVFSESDALAPEKRQMGMGRAYRAWKKARAVLDPDYEPMEDPRAATSTGLSRTYRSVLRSGGRTNRGRTLGA